MIIEDKIDRLLTIYTFTHFNADSKKLRISILISSTSLYISDGGKRNYIQNFKFCV